jgi:hypothetical protein
MGTVSVAVVVPSTGYSGDRLLFGFGMGVRPFFTTAVSTLVSVRSSFS